MYLMQTFDDLIGKRIVAWRDLLVCDNSLDIHFSCFVTEDKGVLFCNLSTFDNFSGTERTDSFAVPYERYLFLLDGAVEAFLTGTGYIPRGEIQGYIEDYRQKNAHRLRRIRKMDRQIACWQQEVDRLKDV